MGTKIQANAFLHKYNSVIDLDGSTSRGTRPLYHENQVLKNDESPADSFALYDQEKVRRTILEHESIFRHQLQELHRLYGRQRELMNEIRFRGMSKDGVKEEKGQLLLFSQNLLEDARKPRGPYHSISGTRFSKVPVFESSAEKRNHQGSYDTDNNRFSLINGVQLAHQKADAFTFNSKRKDNAGDIRLLRGEISTNSCSNFNLMTKDFFPSSVERLNGEKSQSILGLTNERRGKERLCDDYDEKWRFNKVSSGKPLAFPQSLMAEPKKEFSNCWLDISASVSRKRKKIFGVEICEENDDSMNAAAVTAASKMLDQKDENNRVFSSSWIDNSFMQSLHLRGKNPNERSKADMKCELISSKERFSNHSDDMQGKWLEGCSKVPYQRNISHPDSYFKNVDNMNLPIEKDSQNSEGGLPWFLRNSKIGDNQSEEKKKKSGCYFMNLDSLQNSSRKFFGKTDDTFQNSNQILGTPISDVLQGSSNGGMSDLRHCIDLNLSWDEEDALSAPCLPTGIVKKVDLEASTVIEVEECDKIAAEAMVAISLSPESSVSIDSLKWFAEIVCSESSIPDGMDYFECMTLKLEDTKNYEPLVLNNVIDDETSRRCRRRGRHRKDFQRDILPGLVTLSRVQVTEDFQAFDELMKAGGCRSSRNGRGRRRPGGATTVKTLCSTEAQQPLCQVEERSLAGWGKRTRRLPRQRCSNAFISFPVKC